MSVMSPCVLRAYGSRQGRRADGQDLGGSKATPMARGWPRGGRLRGWRRRVREGIIMPHPHPHGGRMFARASLVTVVMSTAVLGLPADALTQAVDAARLVEAEPTEWLSYGRDYAETHYSPLADIT